MKKTILSFAVFFFLLASFTGCSINNNNSTPGPAAAVLFVAASPDAANVNIFVNANNVSANMPYGTLTSYSQITPGATALQVTLSGNSTPVINTTVTTLDGKYYSVFLVDSVSKIKASVVEDELQGVSPDSIRIRFFNFSPNTTAIDLTLADSTVISGNRTFNDQNISASYQKFISVKKGTYSFEVKQAGTSVSVLSLPGKDLSLSGTYTLFLKGFVGGTAEKALGMGIIRHS